MIMLMSSYGSFGAEEVSFEETSLEEDASEERSEGVRELVSELPERGEEDTMLLTVEEAESEELSAAPAQAVSAKIRSNGINRRKSGEVFFIYVYLFL